MGKLDLIRLGTRGSALALAQTDLVINEINKKYPEIICEKVILHTTGDKILNEPLVAFGGKGVFVTEFEDALLSRKIDLAVHSAKDMPTEIPDGLQIAGVLSREDARDVLITLRGHHLKEKDKIIIGTGSLRRQYQICELYQNATCKNLRGNVTTRLERLKEGLFDGIILAAAGIKRLHLEQSLEFEYRYLEYEEMIPSGGQGIIAVEGRKNDEISELITSLSDKSSFLELEIERLALNLLEAGCHEAVGVISTLKNQEITVSIAKGVEGKMKKVIGKTRVNDRVSLVTNLVNQLKECKKL